MKTILTIVLILIAGAVRAQQKDTIAGNEANISKIRTQLDKSTHKILDADTIKDRRQQKFDSLNRVSKHILDSLDAIENNGIIKRTEDKVLGLVEHPLDSVSNTSSHLQQKVQSVQDSVNAATKKFVNKVGDGVPSGIKSRADSLQQKVNVVGQKLSNAEKKIEGKADSLEQKATSAVNAAEKRVESKIKDATGENTSLPGVDKMKVSSSDIPGVNAINEKLPATNTNPPIDKAIKSDIPGANELNIPKNLPDAQVIPDLKTPQVNQLKTEELNKVGNVSTELKGAEGKLGEAEKYEGEIQKLKSGQEAAKLEQDAQQQAENYAPVKDVKTQLDKSAELQKQQQELIKKYTDKKLLREEINRKAKNVANDFMGEHAAQLQSAQAQLAKNKRPFGNVRNVKDAFKRRSDELDGRKFYQRLVPGITLQSYHNDVTSFLTGLQLGYRISPRLTGGVGFLSVIGFTDKYKYYVKSQDVFGSRGYFDMMIAKGFLAHAEFEALRLSPVSTTVQKNEVGKVNLYASYVGLGKRFKITRNIKGNVLGLYRIDYNGSLPSISKVSVRVGFDYVFRKPKIKLK